MPKLTGAARATPAPMAEFGTLLRRLHDEPAPPFRVRDLEDPFASVAAALDRAPGGLDSVIPARYGPGLSCCGPLLPGLNVIASVPVNLAGQGTWPPMLWIGGGQGAGKTTLSWHLSRAYDLPLHRVDSWTYDHQARMPAGDSLDQELARGPEAAADAFESRSRLRLGLVLGDITQRGLGRVPAIVEGPQLMPGLAAQLPPGWGVWLLPDPARTRLVRKERLADEEALAGRPAAGRSRARLTLQRDAILTSRIRESAVLADRPVIEVPPSPDWPEIAAAIESALAPALAAAPRLAPGSELSRQRRYENKAADLQGRLWMQAAGLASMPAYSFGCECGESGCRATWTATPDEYAARTEPDHHLIAHDVP